MILDRWIIVTAAGQPFWQFADRLTAFPTEADALAVAAVYNNDPSLRHLAPFSIQAVQVRSQTQDAVPPPGLEPT